MAGAVEQKPLTTGTTTTALCWHPQEESLATKYRHRSCTQRIATATMPNVLTLRAQERATTENRCAV